MKRIYSLNLAGYLYSRGFRYVVGQNQRTRKHFFVFDETEEVAQAIEDYKNDDYLQEFIVSYRMIKRDMSRFDKELRNKID